MAKTLKEIKREKRRGDYVLVSELANVSSELVKKVVGNERTDHHRILPIFSEVLESRERVERKVTRKRNNL